MSSFTFTRRQDLRINKKNVSFATNPKINNNIFTLNNSGGNLNLSVLSLGGEVVKSEAGQLNYISSITPGIGAANKALIPNSSNEITNINTLSCNSLVINGNNITIDNSNQSTGESNSPYLQKVKPGFAIENKAIIVDNSRNISNINKFGVNELNYGNTSIINTPSTVTKKKIYPITFTANATTYTNNIVSVAWSPELSLAVAISNNGTGSRVLTSTNGTSWTSRNTPADNNWTSVTWSSELGIFVAVSSTGTGDMRMISFDGITWTQPTSYYPVSISAARSHFTILTNNGTIISSGDNNYGQLGITPTTTNIPVLVNGLNGVTKISNNEYYTLLLMNDGTVKSMGYNLYGQLGIGTTVNSNTPITIPNLNNVIDIAAGYQHSLALLSDGTIKSWGNNNFGQLGNGTTTINLSPVSVNNINNVTKIKTYYQSSYAILSDGTVKAWGNNDFNMLGIGTTVGSRTTVPITIPGINNVIDISSGIYHTLVLLSDGTIKSIGYNNLGQLGNNSTTNSTSFVNVSDISNAIAISSYDYHNIAVLSDGTVKSWGANNSGQLGIGTTINSVIPVAIPNITNAIMATTSTSTFILLSDGTIKTCGQNTNSMFGNGLSTSSTTLVNSWSIKSTDCTWSSVTWSPQLSQFAAVASSGGVRVMTSSDGINWYARVSNVSNSNAHSSICWSPQLSLFLSVASNGASNQIMRSSDGLTWSNSSAAATNTWTSVIWASWLNLFIAISSSGTGNRIMTSPNGTTWTSRISPADNNWVQIIAIDDLNLLIAIANSGTNRIMYSENGIEWYLHNSTISDNLSSIVWMSSLSRLALTSNISYLYSDYTNVTTNVLTTNNWYNLFNRVNSAYTITQTGSNPDVALQINSRTVGSSGPSLWYQQKIQNFNSFIVDFDIRLYGISNPADGTTFNVGHTDTNFSGVGNTGNAFTMLFYLYQFGSHTIGIHFFINGTKISTTNISISSLADDQWKPVRITYTKGTTSTWVVTYNNSTILNYNDTNNSSWLASSGDYFGFKSQTGGAYHDAYIRKFVLNTVDSVPQTITQINSKIYTSNQFNNYDLNSGGLYYKALMNTNNNLFHKYIGTDGQLVNTTPTKLIWVKELSTFYMTTENNSGLIYFTSDGYNWSSISTGVNILLRSIVWSSTLNLLVAIGTNTILTSSNGVTWYSQTAPATPSSNDWKDICWSPELNLFVAVSNNATGTNATTNRIMTSSNGVNWTIRTGIANAAWSSICWSSELNLFVVVAASGTISAYSSDGITWTVYNTITGTASSTAFRSVCWSSDLYMFVAISNDRVIVSRDGKNWSYRSIISTTWQSIIWAAGFSLFMAVTSSNLLISNDGNVWTNISVNNGMGYVIAWSDELNNFLTHSNPGDTWSSTCTMLNNIKFSTRISNNNNNLSYLTNYTKNYALYNSWNLINTSINNEWSSITYAPDINLLVAVSKTGNNNRVIISSDGVSWSSKIPASDNNWTSICWASNLDLFVAVASSGTGNRVMTSSDGITWTSRTSAIDNDWTSVCWSSELSLFVAVASSGSGSRVMTSSDGIIWTPRTSASDNNWTSACWSSELSLFVAVASSGSGNRVMTSPNGITWTSRTSASNNDWTSICWAEMLGLFVAVASSGTGNRIMTSPDGITWTSRTSPADNNWTSITWSINMNVLIAVANTGNNNRIMMSYNGINWFTRTSVANYNWTSIIWSDMLSKFISISDNGYIMNSKEGISTSLTNLNTYGKNQISTEYNRLYINGTWGFRILNISSNSNFEYLRLTYNNDSALSVDFSSPNASSLQLNIVNNSNNKILNISNHNGSTFGLALNNTIIPVSANDLNKLNVTTNGIAEASKALILNSQKNISNINNITVNSLYVDGKIILNTNDNNNASLTNITPGTVTESKLLVLDSNRNISTFNNLTSNIIKLKNVSNVSTKLNSNTFNPITKYMGDSTIVNSPNNLNRLNMITWSPELGMFVAITSNHNSGDNQFYNYMALISYDGINWSNVYIPRISNYTNLNSIVWSSELSMFVIVSADSMSFTNAIVHYSYDGLIWYRIDTGISGNTWNSVCWSPQLSLFVAVGASSSNNRVMTSSNGITWTTRTAAVNNNWTSVCWSPQLSLFVAVSNSGTGNRVMTSSDGITWTSRTSASDSDWRSITWSSSLSLFVAVGSGVKIMTSSNGTSWTIRTTTSTSVFYSVIWVPSPVSAFFAVGDTGSNNRIIKSTNGIDWTIISTTNLNIDYRTISYSPSLNLILAGGRGSGAEYDFNCISTSSNNGDTWSLINTNYNLDWYDMIYINELSIFVTVSGNAMSSSNIIKKQVGISSDGINWSFSYITNEYNPNAIFSSIAWSPSLSLAVVTTHTNDGTSIPAVYTSSDCITWTKRTVPSGNWRSVKWISELSLFLAVSSSGSNRFITSIDGINWTANSALLPATGVYTIDYSSSLNILIASGIGSSNNYHTSTDGGQTWTTRTLVASGVSYNITNATCVTWISELSLFIMFQINTAIYYYSYDGINWSSSTFQFVGTTRTFTLRNITSRPIWISKFNKLYVISNNNFDENCEVYESSNGITWTNYYPINSKNILYNNLCWSSAKNTLISFGNNTNTRILGEPFIVLNKYIESNINYNISAINKLNKPSTSLVNESINTWVSRTSSDNNNWNSICYSEDLNLYAAVASSGNNRIMTSPDSVTWTSRRAVGTDLGTVLLSSIETGLTHSIALLSDGTLRAWGSNASGQLGTGNTTQQTTPISTISIANAVSVAAGDAFSLVLLTDGTIRSFGLNSNGQLGNGSTTNSLTPVTVTGINTAISINSGNLHSLALLSNGTIQAWGRNVEGQLGDGTTTNRLTSVSVSGITNAVAVSAGNSFSLALLSDGTIRAWGNNANGQLGDGTTINRLTPVTVSGITTAIAISASYNNHSLALLANGTVMAWGLNNYGQIGNASGVQQIVPTQVFNLQNVVSIQTGVESSFAILNNGTVQAWGRNTANQLGEGGSGGRLTPYPVSNLNNVILLSSCDHSLALLADGTLKSWGNNANGQLGDNTQTNKSTNVNVWTASGNSNILSNVKIPDEIYNYNNNNWTSICWSSKLSLFAAVSNSGVKNRAMISSDGITWITKPTPVDNNWTSIIWSKTLDLFVAVSNSGTNNRIMTSTNGLDWEVRTINLNNNWSSLCYSDELNLLVAVSNSGTNNRVMTSNDAITWTSRTTPIITTINSPTYIKYISTSIEHSLALMSDGTVKAWGNNTYGQLGDGTTNQSNTPITVSGLSNVIGISTSTYSSFALLSDGTIKAWGYNLHGELGDSTDVDKLTPVSVTNITTAINIASGDGHGIALLSDGTVKAWGMNNDGQLGDETTNSSLSPVTVSNLSNVIAIAANGSHNLALINDNTVKSWGYNDWGQLGNNSTISSSSVTTISNLSNVKKIACGSFHSLALLNDGTVKAWGINGYGQLGDETNSDQLIPVNVSGLSNVKDISAGYQFSLALLENGTIKSWGDNYYGKLGVNSEDNVLINSNTALTVSNISTGNSISAGGHHALAILDNGNVMSWGRNNFGQLGNNSTTNSISPINVYSSSISSDPLTNAKLIQYSSVSYNDWTSICWSSELELFVAVANSGSNNRVMTSPDGITWTSRTSAANNNWTSICWAKELGIFIAVSSSGTNNRIMVSTDGINWSTKNNIIDNDWSSICWSNGHNLAVAVSTTGTNNRVLTSTLTLPYLQSSDYLTPDVLFVNQTNGRVGLGTTNPSYQLELSANSAAKPSTSVWSVSSDKRLKENIQNANLEMCLDIIKQLNLSKYKWKNEYIDIHNLDSDKQLGWLADDVEKYLPKAVRTIQAYNYNDCKTLDSDQIIAVMYGGLKKLLIEFEEQNIKIQNLKNEIINLDNYVDQFELE